MSSGLCGQGADLDEIVGEDAVSTTGSGTAEAGQVGAVPAVAAFEVVDPAFASGAPFDFVAESSAALKLLTGRAGAAHARDRYGAHTELV